MCVGAGVADSDIVVVFGVINLGAFRKRLDSDMEFRKSLDPDSENKDSKSPKIKLCSQ